MGLKAKMYSLKYDGKEDKKAKGVKKSVVKKELTHENYKKCLFNNITYKHEMVKIQSVGHQASTIKQNKTSLSAFDDKRYILENGIKTVAHGHFKLDNTSDL